MLLNDVYLSKLGWKKTGSLIFNRVKNKVINFQWIRLNIESHPGRFVKEAFNPKWDSSQLERNEQKIKELSGEK